MFIPTAVSSRTCMWPKVGTEWRPPVPALLRIDDDFALHRRVNRTMVIPLERNIGELQLNAASGWDRQRGETGRVVVRDRVCHYIVVVEGDGAACLDV